MNRIRIGFLLVRNPFNAHQVKRVDLSQGNVDVIVFWMRDLRPLLGRLDELDTLGYRYYFHLLPEAVRAVRSARDRAASGIQNTEQEAWRRKGGMAVRPNHPVRSDPFSQSGGADQDRELFVTRAFQDPVFRLRPALPASPVRLPKELL